MRGDRSHVIAVVKSRDGTLPLLFVDGPAGGGIMREQVALVRHVAGQGYSPSQQMKLTESIGRFCDWMQLAEPETLPAILRRFLVERVVGFFLDAERVRRAGLGVDCGDVIERGLRETVAEGRDITLLETLLSALKR